MAAISKYQTASGATLYRVRYRTPEHKQTDKRGFKTKRAAEVEVSKMRGEYIAPALGKVTVAELSNVWLGRKEQATAPSNYSMIESAWRVHVEPRWGTVSVVDVDVLAVEAWVTEMVRKGSGATTVLRAHGVLSGILTDAVKARRLAVNPAKGIEGLPRKSAKRHVYLSSNDVARLADEAGEHRALVMTLAYRGIRWGEAVALRARDIEFLRRRLSIHENAVQLGVDHAVGATKGRKARSVPVPTFVLDKLAALCTDKGGDALVFTGRDGGGYLPRPKSAGGWFAAAVKRAGVQPITPHDLRHTCASLSEVRGIASDASFGVVGDRELIRDFGFGAAAGPAWRCGRHAI